MTPGRWLRSLPTIDTVINLVAEHYPIDPVHAVLVRPFTNDVYRIDCREGSYALKIYAADVLSADEVRWEQHLVRHLVDHGLPVAPTVDLVNGDCVGTLEAPEGVRPFALTAWLPGAKPRPPWTDDLYRRFGILLAQLHEAADSFRSDLPRQPIRTGSEADEVISALEGDPVHRRLVETTAEAARREVERLSAAGLRPGICQGDFSLDNVHVDNHVDNAGRLYLYDLDLAGPGWPVEDLTGALSTDFGDVFLEAYRSVRPLSPVELEALPWLGILATIDNLHFHLVRKPRTHGSESLTEGWVDRGFAALEEAVHRLG